MLARLLISCWIVIVFFSIMFSAVGYPKLASIFLLLLFSAYLVWMTRLVRYPSRWCSLLCLGFLLINRLFLWIIGCHCWWRGSRRGWSCLSISLLALLWKNRCSSRKGWWYVQFLWVSSRNTDTVSSSRPIPTPVLSSTPQYSHKN